MLFDVVVGVLSGLLGEAEGNASNAPGLTGDESAAAVASLGILISLGFLANCLFELMVSTAGFW